MGVHRTRGEPNGIKKDTHLKSTTPLLRGQAQRLALHHAHRRRPQAGRTCHKPFKSTPMGVNSISPARLPSSRPYAPCHKPFKSTPMGVGSVRFRPLACMYDAPPWGVRARARARVRAGEPAEPRDVRTPAVFLPPLSAGRCRSSALRSCSCSGCTTPPRTTSCGRSYAPPAVQFHPNGGQFDFLRSSARTRPDAPWVVRVASLAKSRETPTWNLLPLFSVSRHGARSRCITAPRRRALPKPRGTGLWPEARGQSGPRSNGSQRAPRRRGNKR